MPSASAEVAGRAQAVRVGPTTPHLLRIPHIETPRRLALASGLQVDAVMELVVSFPGGKRVEAQAGPFTIATDQSRDHGGEGSAPEPFTLFLASLATCAGLYVLAYCRARNIPTDGIHLVQRTEGDGGRLARVVIEVQVPADFPAHHREPLARAAAACKVKKVLADPPELDVRTVALRSVA